MKPVKPMVRGKGGKKASPSQTQAVSWEDLTEILGEPPHGKAGTSVNPAGGVYGESSPNSRRAAREDALKFEKETGRKPTKAELRMIEQRHLGWGYQ